MAGVFNFPKHKRGTTLEDVVLTLLDADDNPISCAGASVLVQVRKSPSDPVVLEWSTVDSTITITGDDDNVLTFVEREPADMDIVPGIYKYDILVTFADGTVDVPIEGTIQITDKISQA